MKGDNLRDEMTEWFRQRVAEQRCDILETTHFLVGNLKRLAEQQGVTVSPAERRYYAAAWKRWQRILRAIEQLAANSAEEKAGSRSAAKQAQPTTSRNHRRV